MLLSCRLRYSRIKKEIVASKLGKYWVASKQTYQTKAMETTPKENIARTQEIADHKRVLSREKLIIILYFLKCNKYTNGRT